MSFSNMLEILKEKNRESIVFIKVGAFYIATGKDAVYLNKEIGLKCVCFKEQICKIGIPEKSIERYLRKLEMINLGYVVYNFDHENEELVEQYKYIGGYHKETRNNRNCLICKGIKNYREDKYMNALKKLIEEEIKNWNI